MSRCTQTPIYAATRGSRYLPLEKSTAHATSFVCLLAPRALSYYLRDDLMRQPHIFMPVYMLSRYAVIYARATA